VRKISSPPGFDPRTFQPVASRYTDYAIPVPDYALAGTNFFEITFRERQPLPETDIKRNEKAGVISLTTQHRRRPKQKLRPLSNVPRMTQEMIYTRENVLYYCGGEN
jgi:hypothetical protein